MATNSFIYRGNKKPSGNAVSGIIKAENRETAIASLTKQSIEVSHIEVHRPAPKVEPPLPPPPPKAVPAAPTPTLPLEDPPSRKIAQLWKGHRWLKACLLFSLVYVAWAHLSAVPDIKVSKTKSQTVEIKLVGKLDLNGHLNPDTVGLDVFLPEIPKEEFYKGKALFGDADGSFALNLRLQTSQRPTVLKVRAIGIGTSSLPWQEVPLNDYAENETTGDASITCQVQGSQLLSHKPARAAAPPSPPSWEAHKLTLPQRRGGK